MIRGSFATRAMCLALLPAIGIVTLLCLWFYQGAETQARTVAAQSGELLIQGIALAGEPALAAGNEAELNQLARSTAMLDVILAVRFSDISGRVLAQFGDTDRYEQVSLGATNSNERIISVDVAAPDTIGQVSALLDLDREGGGASANVSVAVAGVLVVLLIAGGAAWFFARSIVSPLHQLLKAVDQVARQQVPVDLPLDALGEIGELAVNVDRLSREARAFHRGIAESTRLATRDLADALGQLDERKDELQQARALAGQASASASNFMTNVSHEIRTPMNTLIGTLSLLRANEARPVKLQDLEAIEHAAQQLLVLFDDVLDASRIQAGFLELRLSPVRIDRVLADVDRTYAPVAQRAGIELSIDAKSECLSSVVMADDRRLKQLLGTLVANAIKFTRRGFVRLSVTKDRADDRIDSLSSEVWCFSIVDSGVGISVEKQSEIFALFAQGDTSTSRSFGGLGLGLFVCREIVERMDGTIAVASAPGVGARFDIRLPLAAAESGLASSGERVTQRAMAERDDHPRSDTPQVLAVDDQAINLELLKRLFGYFDIAIDVAQSSEQARRQIEQRRFDLILLDLHMPERDGFAVAAEVRRGGLNPDSALLAVTADASKTTHERAQEAGFDDVIVKPVTLATAAQIIDRWLPRAVPGDDEGLAARQEASTGTEVSVEVSVEACAEAVFGDLDWAVQALTSYRDEIPSHMAALRRASSPLDSASIFEVAHALKGLSDVCRIERVSQAAANVCRAVTDGQGEPLADLVAALMSELSSAGKACDRALSEYRARADLSPQI